MTKCKSRWEFGFQVSSDLGVFRCAVWHYISSNELPEQSFSLSFLHPVLNPWRREGSRHFAVQAVLCNCPVLIWPSLAANIFFALYPRTSFFFLSQHLSHSHFSALKPGGAHWRKGAQPDTHQWIGDDPHVSKCI